MLINLLKGIPNRLNSALKSTVVRSMVLVAAITFLTKALAFYKETIVAGSFGLNEVIDTFIIASLIPTFINSVFISSLTNLFIPNYITELKHGKNKAGFQSVVFLMVIAISLVSMIIAYFSFDFIVDLIYPNKSPENYKLVRDQFYIILPFLIIYGIEAVLAGLLEVENKFLISTIVGLFPIITVIILLLFFKEDFGSLILAYGSVFGSILSFSFLLFFVLKYKYLSLGKPVLNENSKLMLTQLPPKVSSGFLSVMNNFVDQFFAGQLVVGSLAALSYGNRIPAFVVSIVIMSLGNVLLPHFSRLVNENLKSAYLYLFKILKLVFALVLIFVVVSYFTSDWVIELWLERDKFTHEDTLKVSTIQQILLFNIPFYLCTLIMVKFLTSINKNNFMALISLANLIINIVLNVVLIKYYGVYGLAASTSLVLIISSCFYFGYTYKQYKKLA